MRYVRFIVPSVLILLILLAGIWFYFKQHHSVSSVSNVGLPTQAQRQAALALIPQQVLGNSSNSNLYSEPNSEFQNITNPPPVNGKAIGLMVAHIQPAPVFGMRALHPVVVGASFHLFVPTITPSNMEIPTGCSAQFITAMVSDGQGGVWIADEDTGIYHGTPTSGRFPFIWTNYNAQNSPGLVSDNIYSLCMDFQGRLWAGTLRDGVCVFNGKQWANYNILTGPLGAHVFAIGCDPKDGSVWMCTENGISIYNTAQNTWRYITRADGLPPNPDCLAFTQDGTAYVGTQCDGLAISSYPYSQWRVIRGPDQLTTTPYGPGLPGNLINSIAINNDSLIYVGTDEGLAISDDGGKSFYYERGRDYADKVKGLWRPPAKWQYPSQATLNALLPEDHITCLTADNAGHLWLGTWRTGYERLDIPRQTSYQAAYPDGVWTGLNGSSATIRNMAGYVNTVLPLQNGDTLIGWYGGGVTLNGGAQSTIQADQVASVAKTIPLLPFAAPPSTDANLAVFINKLHQLPNVMSQAAYLGTDWTTEGDWVGRYGRQYAILCAGNWPLDNYVSHGSEFYEIQGQMGPHHSENDGMRRWLSSSDTNDPRTLYDPCFGLRRQTEWDDHGEAYPAQYDGPDLWIKIRVPGGVQRVSLYFINNDGQKGGKNPLRDYLIELKKWSVYSTIVMKKPTLARVRVSNFYGGVYEQFLIAQPGWYVFVIHRNSSFNTICSAVLIDRLIGPETALDAMPLSWLGDEHFAPPEVSYSSVNDATVGVEALRLWSALDVAWTSSDAIGLQMPDRILAYRTALADKFSDSILTNWRWKLNIWTPSDRQEFAAVMARGWQEMLKIDPSLANNTINSGNEHG
ncbi:MAG TPA: two-component regulator propeller domain-containing protein [Phycisphaerae bacterium]|nr:two-component regulator propeller domain-containing protein [Phycisphaerae bacterium]